MNMTRCRMHTHLAYAHAGAGLSLPRPRDATDGALLELLEPYLDETVRRELAMRRALNDGDLGLAAAIDAGSSTRGKLLALLRRAVAEERYGAAAELAAELRVETARRADVTQDEGAYDRCACARACAWTREHMIDALACGWAAWTGHAHVGGQHERCVHTATARVEPHTWALHLQRGPICRMPYASCTSQASIRTTPMPYILHHIPPTSYIPYILYRIHVTCDM